MKTNIINMRLTALLDVLSMACSGAIEPEVPSAKFNELSQDPEIVSSSQDREQVSVKSQPSFNSQINVQGLQDGSFNLTRDAVSSDESVEYLVYYSDQLLGDKASDVQEKATFFDGTTDTTVIIEGLDARTEYYFDVLISEGKGFRKIHKGGKGRLLNEVCTELRRRRCVRLYGCLWKDAKCIYE